ncbi:MGH1-like glycoside hydrolase domain-containing protein [Frigoribacterium sp. Leaf263]|uniref:MGH1-like glycoside hydrolase domain-containing protein n=1 Tax=Frigoribacterium sp. Leaf263 TaxID=1736313 RepID=UPI000B0C5FC6|nr:glycogen debranching N-terminal domain-containing protein [Frigoribacterium sp. Leaf263]
MTDTTARHPADTAPERPADAAPAATPHLQPLLGREIVVLRAPAQAWSADDGSMTAGVHGFYLGDVRLVAESSTTVDGLRAEHIATVPVDASTVRFESLLRAVDDRGADPGVRMTVVRTVSSGGAAEQVTVTSRLDRPLSLVLEIALRPDASALELVKSGREGDRPEGVTVADDATGASWVAGGVSVDLVSTGRGGAVRRSDENVVLRWPLEIAPRSAVEVGFDLRAVDPAAVVAGVPGEAVWAPFDPAPRDDRLARWLDRARSDLSALRLTTPDSPDDVFYAAGAPWFFTLFGRDSLWAARFTLPVDLGIAAGTLRVLARLQGTESVPDTAEQPGKIMHELRQQTLTIPDEGVSLPPLYYGTVDATPLWVCLLHDAWRRGLDEAEVEALLPNLEAALAWMRDFGDSDGDGLLEYVDETGHGLANQGWKDSGDSVQWRDGSLAEGPIALCEVQAYAYEAAVHGADLLDRFGRGGGDGWRRWAAALRERFRTSFWVSDVDGDFPAIALDAAKRPVDTVTSNLGHLLGTGLLDEAEEARVAARLVSPELASGFGLRTLSSDSDGFWPLSYHGGSVWTHDTAIAVSGLARAGFAAEAQQLADGLLAAAPAFDYRMPELHSGDSARDVPAPVPYPASCRPQAWSAAAAVAVWAATHGVVAPGS